MQSLTNQSAFGGTLAAFAAATEVYLSPAAGLGGAHVAVKVRLSGVTPDTAVAYAASIVAGSPSVTYPLPTAAGSVTIDGTVGSIQFGPAYLEQGEQLKITLDNPGASIITVVSSSRDLASVTTDAASRTASQADDAAVLAAIAALNDFDPANDEVDVGLIEGTDATDVLAANPVLVALAPLIESGAFTAAALANAPASPLSVPQRDALVAAAAVIDTALAGLTKPGTGGGLTLRNDFLPNGNA